MKPLSGGGKAAGKFIPRPIQWTGCKKGAATPNDVPTAPIGPVLVVQAHAEVAVDAGLEDAATAAIIEVLAVEAIAQVFDAGRDEDVFGNRPIAPDIED